MSIDFVDVDLLVFGDEEIDSGHARAFEGGKGFDG